MNEHREAVAADAKAHSAAAQTAAPSATAAASTEKECVMTVRRRRNRSRSNYSFMDWIKAHFDCSLDHALFVLRERVKADVEQWQQQVGTPQAKIELTTDGPRTMISRPRNLSSGPWVSFERGENCVLVHRGGSTKTREAQADIAKLIPTVTVEGECRLRHGSDDLEFWQASRLILENVLFG
jgi:hypothetical protein